MKARGPVTVALLCATPLVLWTMSEPTGPRFADARSALSSAAVLVALAGATAFALNLVLGARFRAVDAFFGGVDKMYRFHRVNGRITFALLGCHAGLIVWSRATISASSALSLFAPAGDVVVFLGVVALAIGALTLALTLYARLGHELFVYAHRLFGVSFLAGTIHMLGSPGIPLPAPVTAYLAAVAAAGLGSYAYRSLFSNVLVRRHDYLVQRVDRLDNTVVEISMAPVEQPLTYYPGQFVYVTFYSKAFDANFNPLALHGDADWAVISLRPGEARDQFHPFSLTSSPHEPRLRITVKAVGDFTSALHALDEGAAARVEGPYGRFSYLNGSSSSQVWIAGGIGITPFLSMARSLKAAGRDIDLYYAFKSSARAYFLEELLEIAERIPDLRVIPMAEDRSGFVTAELIESTTRNLRARDVFLCGPPEMVLALRQQLRGKGLTRRQIHFEEFSLGHPRA